MNTMYILIGIPASGKSTFSKDERFARCVRVNLDSLRTRHREQTLLDECFKQKADILIDNTNVTRNERARYINQAKAHGYRVEGFFMQSILKDCIKRNAQREGTARIPDKAVATKSNQLELPSLLEGFDALHFIAMRDNGFDVSPWKD